VGCMRVVCAWERGVRQVTVEGVDLSRVTRIRSLSDNLQLDGGEGRDGGRVSERVGGREGWRVSVGGKERGRWVGGWD
jgi:hypothetical protein